MDTAGGFNLGHALKGAIHAVGHGIATVAKKTGVTALVDASGHVLQDAGKIALLPAHLVTKPLASALRSARLGAVAGLVEAPEGLVRTGLGTAGHVASALIRMDPGGTYRAVRAGTAEMSRNPAWSVVQGAASLVPGWGTTVSEGMALAAAWGQEKSLKDTALLMARYALPGGAAVGSAFDLGVGLAHPEAQAAASSPALPAAPALPGRPKPPPPLSEAGILAARSKLPPEAGEVGKAAFDAGVALARKNTLPPEAVSVMRHALPASSQPVFDAAIAAHTAASPPDIAGDDLGEAFACGQDMGSTAMAFRAQWLNVPRPWGRVVHVELADDGYGVTAWVWGDPSAAYDDIGGSFDRYPLYVVESLYTAEDEPPQAALYDPEWNGEQLIGPGDLFGPGDQDQDVMGDSAGRGGGGGGGGGGRRSSRRTPPQQNGQGDGEDDSVGRGGRPAPPPPRSGGRPAPPGGGGGRPAPPGARPAPPGARPAPPGAHPAPPRGPRPPPPRGPRPPPPGPGGDDGAPPDGYDAPPEEAAPPDGYEAGRRAGRQETAYEAGVRAGREERARGDRAAGLPYDVSGASDEAGSFLLAALFAFPNRDSAGYGSDEAGADVTGLSSVVLTKGQAYRGEILLTGMGYLASDDRIGEELGKIGFVGVQVFSPGALPSDWPADMRGDPSGVFQKTRYVEAFYGGETKTWVVDPSGPFKLVAIAPWQQWTAPPATNGDSHGVLSTLAAAVPGVQHAHEMLDAVNRNALRLDDAITRGVVGGKVANTSPQDLGKRWSAWLSQWNAYYQAHQEISIANEADIEAGAQQSDLALQSFRNEAAGLGAAVSLEALPAAGEGFLSGGGLGAGWKLGLAAVAGLLLYKVVS